MNVNAGSADGHRESEEPSVQFNASHRFSEEMAMLKPPIRRF
jgi:hypothetical protein